ncbi:MAG: acyl-CoA thioesterase [Thermoanaerobaculia bacterium]
MSDPLRHEVEVEVRYAETDQMGVVHHANYLVWFELARTALCARSGHPYAEIERLGYLLMVVGAQVHYRRGARYGDRVRVVVWIERLRTRHLAFAYEVRRDAELLAHGRTEHVWVRRDDGRPTTMPTTLREPFLALAGSAPPTA